MNLEWNVYYHDINTKEITTFNIFDHGRFIEDVKKDFKKYKDKNEFTEALRRSLFYYFCAKCEWEIVLTSWTSRITMKELDRLNAEREKTLKDYGREPYSLYVNPEVAKKIDVYNQVMNNWDVFSEYVWFNRKEFR